MQCCLSISDAALMVCVSVANSNMKNSLPIRESLDWIQILFREKILILLAEF